MIQHEAHANEPIMLVRKETSPEDVPACIVAKGILTATGGKPAMRRSWPEDGASPASSAATPSEIDEDNDRITINGRVVKAGEYLTINGTNGDVMIGQVADRRSRRCRANSPP